MSLLELLRVRESAVDRVFSGHFNYSKTFGVRSLKDPLTQEALSPQSIMWIASCTKLLTTIAAMQCVEQGLVSLDVDVRQVVHELQDLDIIQTEPTGQDRQGAMTMHKNSAPITLRYFH